MLPGELDVMEQKEGDPAPGPRAASTKTDVLGAHDLKELEQEVEQQEDAVESFISSTYSTG